MGGSVDGVGGFTGYRHCYGQLDFLTFSKQPTRDFLQHTWRSDLKLGSTLENGMGGLSNVLSCILLQQPLRILETHQEIVPNEHVGWSRAIEPVDLGIYQEHSRTLAWCLLPHPNGQIHLAAATPLLFLPVPIIGWWSTPWLLATHPHKKPGDNVFTPI